jgi:four helix bundle protein
MSDFRQLKVWDKAHRLAVSVYQAARAFPKDEMYGLTSQMRRAGTSVAANIAEGCGRTGKTELARFLGISMGSASELEYYLLLARDLSLLKPSEHKRLEDLVTEVKRMLTSFIQRLRSER